MAHHDHTGTFFRGLLSENSTPDATLKMIDQGLADLQGTKDAGLARLYLFQAEMLKATEDYDGALVAANKAIELKCDRIHLAYGVKGDVLMCMEQTSEAIGAYQDAIDAKHSFVAAYESLMRALRTEGRDDDAIEVIDSVMKIHPKAVLIRDKAFILSTNKDDDKALALLEEAIKKPPHEETETHLDSEASGSVITLRKAKVAILADLGRFEEANDELNIILGHDPQEEEAAMMKKDIYLTLARDYLGKHDIPFYLDSLVAKVLEAKPEAPIAFMINNIEKEIEKEKSG